MMGSRSFGFSFLTILLVGGCSSQVITKPGPAPAPTTPAQTTPPSLTCPDQQYATLDNVCQAYPTLTVARATTTITPVRDHHTTTIVQNADGPYLYVFGGTDAWTTV